MATIYVKTKEGRMAFYEGKPIPHDKFIAVQDTTYMRRLVEHWEDVEVQGGLDTTQPAAKAAPARGRNPREAAGQQAPVEPRPSSRHPAAPTQAAPQNPAPGTGAPKPTN